MATITRTYDFADGTTAEADQVDKEFDTIYNDYNGGISNDNISASAAIAISKIVTATLATLTGTETLTNKRITKREVTIASSATPTPNSDITDIYTITALAENTVVAAPTGTPLQGQCLLIRYKDAGTAKTIGHNAIYRAIGTTLLTTTVASKTYYELYIYNHTDTKWDCVSVGSEA